MLPGHAGGIYELSFLVQTFLFLLCVKRLQQQLAVGGPRAISANQQTTDSLGQYFDSKLALVDSASSTHGRHFTGRQQQGAMAAGCKRLAWGACCCQGMMPLLAPRPSGGVPAVFGSFHFGAGVQIALNTLCRTNSIGAVDSATMSARD